MHPEMGKRSSFCEGQRLLPQGRGNGAGKSFCHGAVPGWDCNCSERARLFRLLLSFQDHGRYRWWLVHVILPTRVNNHSSPRDALCDESWECAVCKMSSSWKYVQWTSGLHGALQGHSGRAVSVFSERKRYLPLKKKKKGENVEGWNKDRGISYQLPTEKTRLDLGNIHCTLYKQNKAKLCKKPTKITSLHLQLFFSDAIALPHPWFSSISFLHV